MLKQHLYNKMLLASLSGLKTEQQLSSIFTFLPGTIIYENIPTSFLGTNIKRSLPATDPCCMAVNEEEEAIYATATQEYNKQTGCNTDSKNK